MIPPSIYSYIKQEEAVYETEEKQIGDNWHWNMRKFIQLIFHLKNGIFYTGENNWLRVFKNIMDPILNLSYWTEDIDVKDVVFFIESVDGKVLSFLLKKYHDEVYTREHDLDELFDSITESDIDYGGVLVQQGKDKPEVVPLNTIAFCDQTDVLGSPLGLKHYFTPSKLKSMSKLGWGEESNGATISLEELCTLADNEKDAQGTQLKKQNEATGKVIEVYVVRGDLPNHYLYDDNDMEYTTNQIQIVAYYTKKDNTKEGVTLYRKKSDDDIEFFTSQPVFGRALGRGVGESLLQPQIWTNFTSIHKMNLLEAASKVPLYTDDPTYTQSNKIQDMDNLEITTIEDGKRIYQVPTATPVNMQMFEGSINEWYSHAQLAGAAFDPIMGKEAVSGTTFKGQERTVAQGKGLHDRRRGKRAKFIEKLYRESIIPQMKSEILKGHTFLATLSTEELSWISDSLSTNYLNDKIKEKMLEGKIMSIEEQQAIKELYKETFLKKGNKHLLEVLKDEFRDIEIKMGINVANKQKNLADLSDKVLSIFQFVFANPQAFQQSMQIPALAEAFSDILEFSGISISDFSSLMNAPQQIQTTQPELAGNLLGNESA